MISVTVSKTVQEMNCWILRFIRADAFQEVGRRRRCCDVASTKGSADPTENSGIELALEIHAELEQEISIVPVKARN
jgi:hypothetical protein